MGLIRLLTVGRSLSEARDRPHRYKLMNGALPTFGSGPPVERSGFEHWSGASDSACVETESGMNTEAAVETNEVKQAFPKGRWTVRANPFKSTFKSTSPGKPTVQGELSLERVKPVRNDLSDSDLELVAIKKPAEAAAPNVFATASAAEPPARPSVWRRLRGLFVRKAK